MAADTQSGGTFANDSSVGTVSWSNRSNAQSSDNSYAIVSFNDPDNISNYLKVTNFGFTVSSGATIDGIEIKIEKKYSGEIDVRDNIVKLVKGGTIQGNNKSIAGGWPTSDMVITHSSPTDLWGLSWSPSDINASNFGMVISAKQKIIASGLSTGYIDHIQIVVYYTEARRIILI